MTDIHCVTTWSRYDNAMGRGRRRATCWRWCSRSRRRASSCCTAYDGYTTNLPLEDFAAEDAIIAHPWQGEPLPVEHGGPVAPVVPHLYLWKSAKWLHRIEVLTEDRPSYWEERGYHDRGDPWTEQRYSD